MIKRFVFWHTLVFVVLLFTGFAVAEVQAFTHTVKQPFGGSQLPDDARVAAMAKAKREVLEMAGTYPESMTIARDSFREIIPGKRKEYEESLFRKFGDPWEEERNISRNINQITQTNESRLFEHVFGNQYRYKDRYRLNAKAKAHWKRALIKFRNNVKNRLMSDIKRKQEIHTEKMRVFDQYMLQNLKNKQ